MYQKNKIATIVAMVCTYHSTVFAETNQNTEQLAEINVVAKDLGTTETALTVDQFKNKNIVNVKQLIKDEAGVEVNALQRTRAGNEGVNIRGLQGNRVELTVDGIALPESQENKLFARMGQAYGRGDFIEPTALQAGYVNRSGSATGLSGSVNFVTLEPADLLKDDKRTFGGFVSGSYASVDTSTTGTVGLATQTGKYQGMILGTYRRGHETKTNGDVGGTGSTRTEADPSKYKNYYVLVKNYYQINNNNRIGLTFESLKRKTDTEQLSNIGSSTARVNAVMTQTTNSTVDNLTDEVSRNRISLNHLYEDNNTLSVDSKVYYQTSKTVNDRHQISTVDTARSGITISSATTDRTRHSLNKETVYGLKSDATQKIDSKLPQTLTYGVSAFYTKLDNDLIINPASSTGGKISDSKKFLGHIYIEDAITVGEVVFTPHAGLVHYRFKPRADSDYSQLASEYGEARKQNRTAFLPKVSLVWNASDYFKPYLQYSRGFKAPSSQQLATSFGSSTYRYAIVGNANLAPETADNLELGFRGKAETLSYRVAVFNNKYKNFIDYRVLSDANYLLLYQFQNIARARIYGVEAEAKWNFYDNFSTSGSVTYSRGKAKESDGTTVPINSIQPLKIKFGLAYDSDVWGANTLLTHIRRKADKDIYGSMYNPSRSVNLVDAGIYWKPFRDLTLTANINNIFDEKYWNWADISYMAGVSTSASYDAGTTINASNADAYTAPGRNFNIGIRYEF